MVFGGTLHQEVPNKGMHDSFKDETETTAGPTVEEVAGLHVRKMTLGWDASAAAHVGWACLVQTQHHGSVHLIRTCLLSPLLSWPRLLWRDMESDDSLGVLILKWHPGICRIIIVKGAAISRRQCLVDHSDAPNLAQQRCRMTLCANVWNHPGTQFGLWLQKLEAHSQEPLEYCST